MADGHGGYRAPSSPAPVSGPGSLSARTDGGPAKMQLSDAKYGEQAAFQQMQSAAVMKGGPTQTSSTTIAPKGAAPQVQFPTAIHAPSGAPDQPVTHGADAGAGPGMASLGLQTPEQQSYKDGLRQQYGPLMPYLMRRASSQFASQAERDQVNYLLSQIG